ncbi:hypothetical protein [Coleofasciculus sp. FACHB-SPT36]|nr:hypothetical protein [Coleofasciculus sp. FACHB-SPT36]MBD2538353.1 hypothetical protein [Coleofasciculus sp. FACHB-SPT36]
MILNLFWHSHNGISNQRRHQYPKATARDVKTIIPTVLERGGKYFREL